MTTPMRATTSEWCESATSSGECGSSEFSLWVDVKVGTPTRHVKFKILPTGAALNDNAFPCGSCIMPDGFHIFHLYGENV